MWSGVYLHIISETIEHTIIITLRFVLRNFSNQPAQVEFLDNNYFTMFNSLNYEQRWGDPVNISHAQQQLLKSWREVSLP